MIFRRRLRDAVQLKINPILKLKLLGGSWI